MKREEYDENSEHVQSQLEMHKEYMKWMKDTADKNLLWEERLEGDIWYYVYKDIPMLTNILCAYTWPQDKRRALEARYYIAERTQVDFMSREIVSRIDFHQELSEAYAFEGTYLLDAPAPRTIFPTPIRDQLRQSLTDIW